MTNFDNLFNNIIALYEQTQENIGAKVAEEFLQKAPSAVVELVNRYYTEMVRNAERAASGKESKYTDEKFIENYLDPLAVEHNIDSLPSNFTRENLKEFVAYLQQKFSKEHEAKEATNLFKKVQPAILNAVYPGKIKKYDRTNYPGGEKAMEAVLAGFGIDKIKEIERAYRVERTHRLDEQGNPNTVFAFLVKHVFPVLKQLNWPIKDVKEAMEPAGKKWASVYLRDFLTAASNITHSQYEPATEWKGGAEDTYALKQNLRELLRIE